MTIGGNSNKTVDDMKARMEFAELFNLSTDELLTKISKTILTFNIMGKTTTRGPRDLIFAATFYALYLGHAHFDKDYDPNATPLSMIKNIIDTLEEATGDLFDQKTFQRIMGD